MPYYTVIGTVRNHDSFVGYVGAGSEKEAVGVCNNTVYDNHNSYGTDHLVVAAVFEAVVKPLPFPEPASHYSLEPRRHWFTNLDEDKY